MPPDDAPVLPWLGGWLATGQHGTNLARAQLNERHAEILRRWFPGVLPPSGLLADLADCVAYYAQVAAREAVRASLFDLEAS
jgi:hypothetical protein